MYLAQKENKIEKYNLCKFKNYTIKYGSYPCGSGKTYQLIDYIIKNQDKHTLVMQPSMLLVDQTFDNLKLKNVDRVLKIHSNTNPKKVKQKTSIELSKKDGCKALLITHKTRDILSSIPKQWDAFFDEVPDVIETVILAKKHELEFFNNHFDVDINFNEKYYTFNLIKDIPEKTLRIIKDLEDYAEKDPKTYAYWKNIRALYYNAINTNKIPLIKKSVVNDATKVLIDFGDDTKNRKPDYALLKQLKLYFITTPEQFNNSTIFGANFKKSLLYAIFSNFFKVKFEKNTMLDNKVRYKKHDFKHREIEIHYFFERNHYSKCLRDKQISHEGGITTVGKLMDETAYAIADDELAHVTNNDYEFEFGEVKNGVPVKSHGLNNYQHLNNIYVAVALNLSPDVTELLTSLGITSQQIKEAITFQTIYQAVMRISLRDTNSKAPVKIIVQDKFVAMSLKKLLGTGKLIKIDTQLNEIFEKNKVEFDHKTYDANRYVRKKFNKMETKLMHLFNNKNSTEKHLINFDDGDDKNVADLNDNEIAFTLSGSHYAKDEDDFFQTFTTHKNFIKFLKAEWQRETKTKNEGLKINSSVFIKNKFVDSGLATNANFHSKKFLVLDFDNGDLTKDEFIRIFWQQKKHSFVICNSFSTSAEKPNNFRVFLFLEKDVFKHDYLFPFYYVQKHLEANGYYSKSGLFDDELQKDCKNSGLDYHILNPSQHTNIPSINANQKDFAFFETYGCKEQRDIQRYCLKSADIDVIKNEIEEIKKSVKEADEDDVNNITFYLLKKFVSLDTLKNKIYAELAEKTEESEEIEDVNDTENNNVEYDDEDDDEVLSNFDYEQAMMSFKVKRKPLLQKNIEIARSVIGRQKTEQRFYELIKTHTEEEATQIMKDEKLAITDADILNYVYAINQLEDIKDDRDRELAKNLIDKYYFKVKKHDSYLHF